MMNPCVTFVRKDLVAIHIQFLFNCKYELIFKIQISYFCRSFFFMYSCVATNDCTKDLPSTCPKK